MQRARASCWCCSSVWQLQSVILGAAPAYQGPYLRNYKKRLVRLTFSKFAMTQTTFFVKECPTCGRNLQVRIEYLGRDMMCNHCGGDFVANEGLQKPKAEAGDAMIARIDELLGKDDPPGKPR